MGRQFTMSLGVVGTLATLGGFLSSTSVQAYTPTLSPNGLSVRWSGQPKLNFAGNPKNQSGISGAAFSASVVRGLQRWKYASEQSVGFDYWQGTDSNVYLPASDYDGLSTIYFASNEKGASRVSANVLGLTQVWYDTSNGEILEADIVLNDRDFYFTTDAKDTSGYGSGNPNAGGGKKSHVFIENVITHEIGHALGLSHSGGLNSTMLFMESPEQAVLGCDDNVAVHALYPTRETAGTGRLSGKILSESGSAVFGAHVLAISRRRGTVLASAITDKSGNYTISALEPGSYFLIAEPFFAGPQSLPSFYSGIKSDICSDGHTFSRTFLTADDGTTLRSMEVQGGEKTTDVPTFSVVCNGTGGASVRTLPETGRPSRAPSIFNGTTQGSALGVVDRMGSGGVNYYRLDSLGGDLELHVMSYSLYSPIRASLSLLDSAGNPVNAEVSDEVYTGNSGFVNFDSSLVARGLPAGDYVLKVQATVLDSSLYPAGPVSLDAVSFLAIVGSVNEPAPAMAAGIATNARCKQSENFPAYSSPAGDPPRKSTSNQEDDGVGFCGTIQRKGDSNRPSSSGGGSHPGAHLGAIAGWFAPWLAMMGIARLLRRRSSRAASRA